MNRGLTPAETEEMEDVVRELSIAKDRLDKKEIPARAVLLRQDVLETLPALQVMHGLPVIRVPRSAPVRWGLLV